ncbi:hypothetical protein IB276_33230 [Ensifer sp. ENS04]|uniref:hypothetical protein n=1 Tax=Ensifer sp. ENS04 TaxID=2769281 RepID=UPI00178013B4|nr:hypothetical protein [Ensifer sp. ENS04]MBD9544311.1 hypothetical protein [Ensifer sp. ENS04]
MNNVPRRSDRFERHKEVTYETALYTCDNGMWTVIEITKRPILQTDSEGAARALIARLEKGKA